MQAIIIIACVIACVHHIWCWVCAQTKSVMASRSRMYFLRFCCVKAWKGLNYVTSWVKTSSLAIPILFTRKTVWYKYCAIRVVFTCSLEKLSWQYWEAGFTSVLEQVKMFKFYFKSMALVFRNVWIMTCFETFIWGGWTATAQFSKYTPQRAIVVVVVKFKFKSILYRQPPVVNCNQAYWERSTILQSLKFVISY